MEPIAAPRLYMDTDYGLAERFSTQNLHSGRISLGYEGNTTVKMVGTVYMCDINKGDNLQLLRQHEDGNVTYTTTEVTQSPPVTDEESIKVCFTSNLRYMKNPLLFYFCQKIQQVVLMFC